MIIEKLKSTIKAKLNFTSWYRDKGFKTPVNNFLAIEEILVAYIYLEWLRDNGVGTNLTPDEYNHLLIGWGEFYPELEVNEEGWSLTAARDGSVIDSIVTGIEILEYVLERSGNAEN